MTNLTMIMTSIGATNAKIVPFSTDNQQLHRMQTRSGIDTEFLSLGGREGRLSVYVCSSLLTHLIVNRWLIE